MDTREAYKEKFEAKLKEWGAKIEDIKAQAKKTKAQAKIDLTSQMDTMNEKYEAAKARLEKVGHATDEKWHDVKKDADKAWHEAEHSIEGVFAALKAHTKTDDPKKKS